MKRGEIWTGAGSGRASEPRPVVILQSDYFDATEAVTVCFLTSSERAMPLLRVPVPASPENGLSQDSWAMIDAVTTLKRANLCERVGVLEREHLITIGQRIPMFLGLAD